MPFDAFEAKPSKIEVKKEAFKDKEGGLSQEVEDLLTKTQKLLDQMQDKMKKDLNKRELSLANLAIERELEKEMPDDFRDYYLSSKEVGGWGRAVDLITTDVLGGVQDFMVFNLKDVIEKVDAESWTSDLSLDEVADVLKEIDPTISQAEINRIQNQWSGKSENLLSQGVKASRGRHSQIEKAIKEAGG